MFSDLSAGRRRTSATTVAVLSILAGCSKPLNSGAMAKLTMSDHPASAPTTVFKDAAGVTHTLADFKGKVAVVNVWANWCAPCKAGRQHFWNFPPCPAGNETGGGPFRVGDGVF